MANTGNNANDENTSMVLNDVRNDVYDHFKSLAPDPKNFHRQPLPASTPGKDPVVQYYYSVPREQIITRQASGEEIEQEVHVGIAKIFEKSETVNAIYADVNEYSHAIRTSNARGRDFRITRQQIEYNEQVIDSGRFITADIIFSVVFTEKPLNIPQNQSIQKLTYKS